MNDVTSTPDIGAKQIAEFFKNTETTSIKLSDIVRDSKFNSRHILGDIESFSKTIKTNNYLTPPVVREKNGKIHLVAGFRRCAAWEKLWGPTAIIKVDLKKFETEEDAILFNLAENTGRNDLRKYDICERIYELCDESKAGLKGTKVANIINRTQSYVSQCLNIWKDLSTDTKKWWSKIEDPQNEPTFSQLKELSKGTPAEQKSALEALIAGTDNWSEGLGESESDPNAEPTEEKSKPKTKKEIKEKYAQFTAAFEDAEGDEADKIKDRIAVLKWVLGLRKTL